MTMTQQRPESKELSILIKLLKMTTSSHDHEALNAMRLANAQVLKLGTDWEDLLYGKVTLVADPFTSIPEVKPATASGVGQASPPRRPAPPPPPPQPVYYHDAAVIQPLFDELMFANLPNQAAKRYSALERCWLNDSKLESSDYNELRALAVTYAQKRRRRRT